MSFSSSGRDKRQSMASITPGAVSQARKKLEATAAQTPAPASITAGAPLAATLSRSSTNPLHGHGRKKQLHQMPLGPLREVPELRKSANTPITSDEAIQLIPLAAKRAETASIDTARLRSVQDIIRDLRAKAAARQFADTASAAIVRSGKTWSRPKAPEKPEDNTTAKQSGKKWTRPLPTGNKVEDLGILVAQRLNDHEQIFSGEFTEDELKLFETKIPEAKTDLLGRMMAYQDNPSANNIRGLNLSLTQAEAVLAVIGANVPVDDQLTYFDKFFARQAEKPFEPGRVIAAITAAAIISTAEPTQADILLLQNFLKIIRDNILPPPEPGVANQLPSDHVAEATPPNTDGSSLALPQDADAHEDREATTPSPTDVLLDVAITQKKPSDPLKRHTPFRTPTPADTAKQPSSACHLIHRHRRGLALAALLQLGILGVIAYLIYYFTRPQPLPTIPSTIVSGGNATQTLSQTGTLGASPTPSASGTWTITMTTPGGGNVTLTSTPSQVMSATAPMTISTTPTGSRTPALSAGVSASSSASVTATASGSPSPSLSFIVSANNTGSGTPTASISPSGTGSIFTITPSPTYSVTATITPSGCTTFMCTNTTTNTITQTITMTQVPSVGITVSSSGTMSISSTPSRMFNTTATPTPSATGTALFALTPVAGTSLTCSGNPCTLFPKTGGGTVKSNDFPITNLTVTMTPLSSYVPASSPGWSVSGNVFVPFSSGLPIPDQPSLDNLLARIQLASDSGGQATVTAATSRGTSSLTFSVNGGRLLLERGAHTFLRGTDTLAPSPQQASDAPPYWAWAE